MSRLTTALVALGLVAAACGGGSPASAPSTAPEGAATGLVFASGAAVPPPPETPSGPLAPEVVADLDRVFADLTVGTDLEAIERLGSHGDPRVAWLLSDLLRFLTGGEIMDTAVAAFEELSGVTVEGSFPWGEITNLLIAWDLEAPPGYLDWKRRPYEIIEPDWKPFFDDADSLIDWRLVSWGGVRIDDRHPTRAYGPCPDGCIPALNNPGVTDATGGAWYPNDAIVFGAVVNGEARAYPKHIMEVHEMVNDTLGGRRIGIPYCTLCGSAQGYFTDDVPEGFDPLELRTSGLLIRSNKMMYDWRTFSMIDTFLGTAVSGPLREAGYRLDGFTVVASTWGAWKETHPDTTIVAIDGGIGRTYPADPLRGRDDNGPIFPIGDVDPRLPVQEQVVGVVAADGVPLAFPVEEARRTLEQGGEVELNGIRLALDGDGLVAVDASGAIDTHQAFWFAWSQFHEGTQVWTPLG